MISVYNEIYFDDAICNLGEAFEYAAVACHIELQSFFDLFVSKGYAESFENCNPRVIAGLSGTELAKEVLSKSGMMKEFPAEIDDFEFSPEYWCGYILGYYQVTSGRRFKDIGEVISMNEILKLYPTLHEAPEDKFADVVNHKFENSNLPTKLQKLRKVSGLTQKELSRKSGVNQRTLEQYESRSKNINNAAAVTVFSLARCLECKIEDLLE